MAWSRKMKDLKMFEKDECLKVFLEKAEEERHLDQDHYKQLVSTPLNDKFTDEFIGDVYKTLEAWGMNSRAAKLKERSAFIQSLKNNKDLITHLDGYTLPNLGKAESTLKKLFDSLELVETKSKLVTFTKTMHFYHPKLVVPIDRRYIYSYFFTGDMPSEPKEQWDAFLAIERAFSAFSQKVGLETYVNSKSEWNIALAKIPDNMIIGYTKLKEECRRNALLTSPVY
jgi:hypothetical protein